MESRLFLTKETKHGIEEEPAKSNRNRREYLPFCSTNHRKVINPMRTLLGFLNLEESIRNPPPVSQSPNLEATTTTTEPESSGKDDELVVRKVRRLYVLWQLGKDRKITKSKKNPRRGTEIKGSAYHFGSSFSCSSSTATRRRDSRRD